MPSAGEYEVHAHQIYVHQINLSIKEFAAANSTDVNKMEMQ